MGKIINFRDVMEHSTKKNKLKQKLIYRSGHTDKISNQKLNAIGIKTIIDLRSPEERKKAKKFTGINTINLPINYDKRILEQVMPLALKHGVKKKLALILINEYKNLVTSQKEVVKNIFDLLQDEKNYPFLIHCRAGKDRTGFIAALLQLMIGFDEQTIVDDYMASNNFHLVEVKKVIRLVKFLTLGLVKTSNIQYILTSHEENIMAIINIIKDQYENIDNYLESCGVTKQQINKVKIILTDKR